MKRRNDTHPSSAMIDDGIRQHSNQDPTETSEQAVNKEIKAVKINTDADGGSLPVEGKPNHKEVPAKQKPKNVMMAPTTRKKPKSDKSRILQPPAALQMLTPSRETMHKISMIRLSWLKSPPKTDPEWQSFHESKSATDRNKPVAV